MSRDGGEPKYAWTLQAERTPTEIIIRYSGRITLDTAALFQNTIRDLIRRCITVDLTHVSRMDSAGVGALAGAWSSARRKSAEVVFHWPESHDSAPPHEVAVLKGKAHGQVAGNVRMPVQVNEITEKHFRFASFQNEFAGTFNGSSRRHAGHSRTLPAAR